MARQVATAGGSSIYVDDAGSGPDMLAIHGLGGGAYFFRGLAERIGHRVHAIDLPGTGRSRSMPAAFTLDTWIADLGDLLATLSAKPVVILGHSLGTILALKLWDAWPERIGALVFVGGLPEVRAVIRERLNPRVKAITEAGSMAGWGEKVSPGIFSAATKARRPEIVALFERLFEAQDPAAYVRALDILLGASAASVPPTVAVPSIAITGADDQYAPPEFVQSFIERVPGTRGMVAIPECAHMPFFEAPDAFGAAVRAFLDVS